MTPGDQYRVKAAGLRAKAQHEANLDMQAELEGFAAAYLRLAEQADRNSHNDISYETPPAKNDDPPLTPE